MLEAVNGEPMIPAYVSFQSGVQPLLAVPVSEVSS